LEKLPVFSKKKNNGHIDDLTMQVSLFFKGGRGISFPTEMRTLFSSLETTGIKNVNDENAFHGSTRK